MDTSVTSHTWMIGLKIRLLILPFHVPTIAEIPLSETVRNLVLVRDCG